MTDTEVEITAELVRDLLQEQHPDLAGLAIREVAGGWGNQMWRLGDELAVRMQRMDRTPELQLKERRGLQELTFATELLVSELVTNAILHHVPTAPGPQERPLRISGQVDRNPPWQRGPGQRPGCDHR